MRQGLKTLALVAALAAGTSGTAMAQYACPAGYAAYNGVCQPMANNPVSGAAQGAAVGAAAGGATGGPVGAVVGGAIGTATGAVGGAVGAVTPGPACAPGYAFYNGACYPAR
jgi:hypothetical protein